MFKQLDIFYHITTPISDKEIERENIKAESLQARVLEFFKNHAGEEFIWSDVALKMGLDISEYGSCKRCITHLYNKGRGVLSRVEEKSEDMRVSIFGGKSHKHVYRG